MTISLGRRLPFDGATRILIVAIVVLVVVAGIGRPQFFSPAYLAQQLQAGAFLGIVATGAMLVILLGHIDLSVPWTMTTAAVVATAVAGPSPEPVVSELALLAGLGTGLAIGLVNGVGVAVLRIPSMIWTLAINNVLLGLVVWGTGRMASGRPSPLMTLGADSTGGVPHVLLVWLVVGGATVLFLRRSVLGRKLVLTGASEVAAFRSGIATRRVIVAAFAAAGVLSALAGMLLAGYAGQTYQRMGDPYLLPGIAAVVLGGTSLFGGRGTYAGTVAGVVLITLMSSMLSLMQAPEAAKQIAYGASIVLIVGLYSRRSAG